MTVYIVAHSTALNSSDNLPSYPPDNHHSSELMTSIGGHGCIYSGWGSGSVRRWVRTYYVCLMKNAAAHEWRRPHWSINTIRY